MFNEYDFINQYPKEILFTLYVHMVDDSREYEKITKKKMLFAIYESLIEDPTRFDGYVSADALNLLKNILHQKIEFNHESIEDYMLIRELQNCFLLSYNGIAEGFQIPIMIQDVVRSIVITDRHKDLDNIYDFLNGVLLVRGQINRDELKNIYDNCKPSYLTITLDQALMSLPRIFLKINEAAYVYEDTFEHPAFYRETVFSNYSPLYIHSWETYLSVGKFGINIYNPILNEFYKKLKKFKSEFIIDDFVENFVIQTQLSLDFDMSRIMQEFVDIESDIDRAVSLYNEVVREIPRWKFKGDPISLVDLDKIDRITDFSQDDKNEEIYCPCGSGLLVEDCCENQKELMKHRAILGEERAQLFYGLYYMLIHKTNQKYKLHPHFSNVERFFDRLSQPDFVKIADKFFDSPEIITEYINQYTVQVTPQQHEILTGFQHAFKKTFVALRYENQKLQLLDEKKRHIYSVSGIVSGIALNIPQDVLPQFIETRLIPLNKEITYDIFMNQIPVIIGPNMRKELKKVEKKSKVIRNIEELLEID